jgi:hypothetical protein
VLRTDSDVRDIYHDSIPFLMVLVPNGKLGTRAFTSLYSSVASLWVISSLQRTRTHPWFRCSIPVLLVGGSLYWVLDFSSIGILEFDLDRQCLAVIDVPPDALAFSLSRY